MTDYGTGIKHRKDWNYTIAIDGRESTISAKVPDNVIIRGRGRGGRVDPVIHTNPAEFLGNHDVLPSLSVVRFAKVKNFIDGVYAAVEERAHEKGHDFSIADLLEGLERQLSGDAKRYITAAIRGEGPDDPTLDVVQGFYDWNEELRAAYRQIKILMDGPEFILGEGLEKNDALLIEDMTRAISDNMSLAELYFNITNLYSKTTSKLKDGAGLFPGAELPDQEFFKLHSLETGSDIPGGLGKALVAAIKEGRVSYEPTSDSGMYIRQMHEIVPLVIRDNPEFAKYLVNDKYGEVLENEFISQWVGTRHTHVGRTNTRGMMVGACAPPRPPIVIQPEIPVEPFSTVYERMENSLNFFERVIFEAMPEVMDRKRLLNDGSRAEETIGKEFADMQILLEGLDKISRDSLHMQYDGSQAEIAVRYAKKWLENLKEDPDLNRNTAIFVPMIRTTDLRRQVCYINAGYKFVDLTVRYEREPDVTVDDGTKPKQDEGAGSGSGVGNDFELEIKNMLSGPRIEFKSRKFRLPMLVHREVRVPYGELINDRRLREMLGAGSFAESELDALVDKLEGR